MTKKKKTIAYKFVKWDVPALGILKGDKVSKLKKSYAQVKFTCSSFLRTERNV